VAASKHTFGSYGSGTTDNARGAWKEIGITTSPSHARQDGLSSPFGGTPIGSDPYSHINLKQGPVTKTSGNVSPWNRTGILANDVKPSQPENETTEPDVQSLRQIERQRSPNERPNNFSWGLNGSNANNHNQRQQQQPRRMQNNKPPLVNKMKGDGGKPRQSDKPSRQGSASWTPSENSWNARPPRIPQVRNSPSPGNPSSRNSPSSRSGQWSNAKDEKSQGNSSVLSSSIGSKNSGSNRSGSSRQKLITKGDPTINSSSSSKRNNSSSSKSKNNKVSEANPFGVKISPGFEDWCLKQINEMTLVTGEDLDGRSLVHFLMTLSEKEEIREYIVNYLGDSQKVQDFADGFIQLKNFESSSSGEPSFQCKESKRSRRKRRKRKGQ